MSRSLKTTKAALYWTLFLAYLAGLYALSAQESLPDIGWTVPDKVAHAIAYFGLLIVARLAIGTVVANPYAAMALAFLATIGYGALDEWHQSFVPDRDADVRDWYADVLGATLAMISYVLMKRRAHVRKTLSETQTRP